MTPNDVRSLLEAAAPAALTTYRRDGSAAVSPVWFRWIDGWFEVVIAKGEGPDGRRSVITFYYLALDHGFASVKVRLLHGRMS